MAFKSAVPRCFLLHPILSILKEIPKGKEAIHPIMTWKHDGAHGSTKPLLKIVCCGDRVAKGRPTEKKFLDCEWGHQLYLFLLFVPKVPA